MTYNHLEKNAPLHFTFFKGGCDLRLQDKIVMISRMRRRIKQQAKDDNIQVSQQLNMGFVSVNIHNI